MIGLFAQSTAGHDKGQLYIIVKEEIENNTYDLKLTQNKRMHLIYVCDGKLKKIENPKRKNLKHIQIINESVNQELVEKLTGNANLTNEEIKRAIKQYQAIGGVKCQKLM